MVLSLALALATTLGSIGGTAPGVVRGQVRSETTGAPLAMAVVEVLNGSSTLRTVTDSTGHYLLRPVTAGRHIIRASHLDHAPFEVEVLVPPGGDMVVDLSLALRPVNLPAVFAWAGRAGGPDTTAASASDLSAASMRLLQASPGVTELGLAQAARATPGAGDPADPTDVLYVRGAAADLNLVLLDGAPVYAPFHVGGVLNPFDPDVLGSATLFVGGAPARYDGGLSYVMDLRTRAGRRDRMHTAGSVDMLSGRVVIDGPLVGGSSYIVAVRGIHGLGAQTLVSGRFPYSYADGQARIDADLGGDRSLRVTGFANHEAVRLDGAAADPAAYWGNAAASVRYRGTIAGAIGELAASIGEFDAMLPVGGEHPMRADGTSRRVRLTADFGEDLSSTAHICWGASYDRLDIHYFGWPLASLDTLLLNSQADGDALGAYMDVSWQPASRVRLRGGVRADLFATEPQPRIGPRVAVTWLPGPRSALTLAVGEYHQYLRATEAAVVSADVPAARLAEQPLSVAEATHLVLSLDQQLGSLLRLGLEGYYKNFSGLPSAASQRKLRARTSGTDVWLRGGNAHFNGWLGYSLAWVWSSGADADLADLFTGRQMISAGAGIPVFGRTHFDVRLSYGSGMPFTAVPQPDRPPVQPVAAAGLPKVDLIETGDPATMLQGPNDPYLRLDAQLARSFDGQYRGIPFEVTPYLRVLNALDRRDALFYQFDRNRDRQPQAVGALPVLPIVGVTWRF